MNFFLFTKTSAPRHSLSPLYTISPYTPVIFSQFSILHFQGSDKHSRFSTTLYTTQSGGLNLKNTKLKTKCYGTLPYLTLSS